MKLLHHVALISVVGVLSGSNLQEAAADESQAEVYNEFDGHREELLHDVIFDGPSDKSNNETVNTEVLSRADERYERENVIREAQFNHYLPKFYNDETLEFFKEYIYTAPLSDDFDAVISPDVAAYMYSEFYRQSDNLIHHFESYSLALQIILDHIHDPRAAYLGRKMSYVIQRDNNPFLNAILKDFRYSNALKMFAVTTREQLLTALQKPDYYFPGEVTVKINLNEDGSFNVKEVYDKVIASPQAFASKGLNIYDGLSIDAGGPRRKLLNQACKNIIGNELNFLKKYPNSEYYKFPMFADPKMGRFVGVIYARARSEGILPPGRLDPRFIVLAAQLNDRDAIEDYWDKVYADEMDKLKHFFKEGPSFGMEVFSYGYKPTIVDIKYFECLPPSEIQLSHSHKNSHYAPQDVRYSGDDETCVLSPLNHSTYLNEYLPKLRKQAIDHFVALLTEFANSFGYIYDLTYVLLLPDPNLLDVFFGSDVKFNAKNVVTKLQFNNFMFDSDSFVEGKTVPASENIEAIVMSMTHSQLSRFALAVTAAENIDLSILSIKASLVSPMSAEGPRVTPRSNIFPEIVTITSAKARSLIADFCNALKETDSTLVIPDADSIELSNVVTRQEYKAVLSTTFGTLLSADEIDEKVQKAFSPIVTEEEINALAQRAFEYQKNRYNVPDAIKSNALPDDVFLFEVCTCFATIKLEKEQGAYGLLYAIAYMLNDDVNYMRDGNH